MPEKLKSIDNIIKIFQSIQLDNNSFRKKVNDQIKIVDEKLLPKRENLENLINRILQREHAITKRISNTSFISENNLSEGLKKTFSKEFE